MKARFKTIILSALGAMAAFTAVTYTSCKPDKCKAIRCAYGGVCNEGTCICPTGYEGPQCEIITQNKFLGVWNVLEKGTLTSTAQYTASIDKNPNGGLTDVLLKHFNNYFTSDINAQVKGDTLYIPQQIVQNYIVQGIGYLTPDKYYSTHATMSLRYSVQSTAPGSPVNAYGTTEGGTVYGDPSLWNK